MRVRTRGIFGLTTSMSVRKCAKLLKLANHSLTEHLTGELSQKVCLELVNCCLLIPNEEVSTCLTRKKDCRVSEH